MCSPIESVHDVELLKDRLYFATVSRRPTHHHPAYHIFCTDDDLVYCNYNDDFGPLSLAMLYRFCDMLNRKLRTPALAAKRIIYYTAATDARKRTNAAFLIGSFCVLYLGRSVEETYVALAVRSPIAYRAFRDASAGPSTYNLTLIDTLHAVAKASYQRLLDFTSFDVDEYEHYERIENGDLNWIVPRKILAFASPHAASRVVSGYPQHAPDAYLPYFRRCRVTTVVRLNSKLYDASRFTDAGLTHVDLAFADGGTPNNHIVQQFLAVCETTDGAVAVHCKAGLGRTGTLVGCYLMKHFRFTAAEAIAWTRIARPGSVLGQQQQFLHDKQLDMWTQGDAYRRKLAGAASKPTKLPSHAETKPPPPPSPICVDGKALACSSPPPEGGPLLAATSQGDQLNQLKLQRCRQKMARGCHGQKLQLARESVKRQHQEMDDINLTNSPSNSTRRTRSRQ